MTWRTCRIHGEEQPNVYGCAECVREMRQKIVDLERQLIGERIAVIEECQAVLQTFPLEETSGTTNLNEIKALWEIMLSPLYVAALDALKNKP